MSASLADLAGRLPAWRRGFGGQVGSPLAKSGWQPDIPFCHAPEVIIEHHYCWLSLTAIRADVRSVNMPEKSSVPTHLRGLQLIPSQVIAEVKDKHAALTPV
jgi:hypothetical protein